MGTEGVGVGSTLGSSCTLGAAAGGAAVGAGLLATEEWKMVARSRSTVKEVLSMPAIGLAEAGVCKAAIKSVAAARAASMEEVLGIGVCWAGNQSAERVDTALGFCVCRMDAIAAIVVHGWANVPSRDSMGRIGFTDIGSDVDYSFGAKRADRCPVDVKRSVELGLS